MTTLIKCTQCKKEREPSAFIGVRPYITLKGCQTCRSRKAAYLRTIKHEITETYGVCTCCKLKRSPDLFFNLEKQPCHTCQICRDARRIGKSTKRENGTIAILHPEIIDTHTFCRGCCTAKTNDQFIREEGKSFLSCQSCRTKLVLSRLRAKEKKNLKSESSIR